MKVFAPRTRTNKSPRKFVPGRSYLEYVGGLVNEDPPERLLSPTAQRRWIYGVDRSLFPFETHIREITRTSK